MSVSIAINADVFLRMLDGKKAEKGGEVRRGALQNDITRIHLALGGELVCEELKRAVNNHLETIERQRQEQESRTRARTLRQQARQLAKQEARDQRKAPARVQQSDAPQLDLPIQAVAL